MKLTRTKALEMWEAIYGEATWASDCFDTWMYKHDYGNTSKKRVRPGGDGKQQKYGWNLDHIRPVSDFETESDATFRNNLEPMHYSNNEAKADNYPHFTISEISYKIVKCEVCSSHNLKGYGIKSEKSQERVDWKAVQRKCFKS